MTLTEYERIKNLTYLEYCDYLQNKYGIGAANYMTQSWNKNPRVTRTKEGLLAHHKYEDHGIMLCNPHFAKRNPYEWQLAENIVYCDYLEHLLLHILICEYPSEEGNAYEVVGIGGVINFLVPELNDFYSGWKPSLLWKLNCLSKIADDKDAYLAILKRFKTSCKDYPFYSDDCLLTSFNERFGIWAKENNEAIFKEIENL